MESLEQIWGVVLSLLKEKNLKTVYELWFADTKLAFLDSENATVVVASELRRDVIGKRYVPMLAEALAEVIGFEVKIIVICERSEENNLQNPGADAGDANLRTVPFDPMTAQSPSVRFPVNDAPLAAKPLTANSEYTFDNFIVGSSNKFAHAASVAVANNPASVYNPLFIYGASGLGKTHLLYAIMNRIIECNPGINVIYVKGEEFMNELVDSIQRKTTPAFRTKYRKADVLLIDDIQFIAGKEGIQEEFFHTFNTLYEDRKQIILAADRPPRDMKTLENRLKTRFEWGLIADIQPPDFELRIAIMKNKASMMGTTLSNDVLNYLAENLRSNIRQLEGAIKKICAQSFLNGVPVTLELAKSCINDILSTNAAPVVTADRIIEKVSTKYGISPEDIKSRKKTKEIANARHICIYIIKKLTDMSYPAIGRIFGRDHTTIMSSNAVIENEIKISPLLEVEIGDIIKDIKE